MRILASLVLALLIGLLGWFLLGTGSEVGSGASAPDLGTATAGSARADLVLDPPGESRSFVEGAIPSEEPMLAAAAEPGEPESPAPASAPFPCLVLAAENDQPLAGVRVRGPGALDLASDAHGRFDLPLPAAAGAVYELRHPDRELGRFRVPPASAQTPEPLRLRLQLAAAIVGRIDGFPAGREAQVVARFSGYHLTSGGETLFDKGEVIRRASVAEDGTFELQPLPPEVPLSLTVRSGGKDLLQVPEELILEHAERRAVVWSLGESATVRVRVTDSRGELQPGVPLELFSASEAEISVIPTSRWNAVGAATTDATGIARFDKVPAGAWVVAPERLDGDAANVAPESALAGHGLVFEVPANVLSVEVDLTVHRGLWIRGRVLDGNGAPAAEIMVSAFGIERQGYLNQTTGAEGAFAIGPLTPGRYSLGVFAFGDSNWSPPDNIEVEAGAEGIEVRLLAGASIEVRLVDAASGSPVTGEVWLERIDAFGYSGTGDGRDTHTLTSLPPGRYHLIGHAASGGLGTLRDVTLAAGSAPALFEIPIHPAGEVRLRYQGPEDYAQIAVVQDGVSYKRDGLRSGTSIVCSAPFGTVTVRFERRPAGGNPYQPIVHEETVFVRPGEVAEVDYQVPESE